MSNLIPSAANPVAAVVSRRAARALSVIEERALIRSAEIAGIAYVGQAALRATAELSMAQAELSKLAPNAALNLGAINDATTVAIQARVLDLGTGL